MNAHRYTFGLDQVKEMLNNEKPNHHVKTEELAEWAMQGCFPVETRNGLRRVDFRVVELVKKVRDLIKIDGYTVHKAKEKLKEELNQKINNLQRTEQLEKLNDLNDNWASGISNSVMKSSERVLENLKNHEATYIEGLKKTEERVKGAVIHSEVRMKEVVERTEKKFLENMENHLFKTQEFFLLEMSKGMAALEESLKDSYYEKNEEKHLEEMKILADKYENLIQEIEKSEEAKYEELINAGLYKRYKLRKEWKASKKES